MKYLLSQNFAYNPMSLLYTGKYGTGDGQIGCSSFY